jgi:hypothetical protein
VEKRITIDGEDDKIDSVFYYRILKCHVLIDLKVRKFKHSDSGQMIFHLNYYKHEVMQATDNSPIGIRKRLKHQSFIRHRGNG